MHKLLKLLFITLIGLSVATGVQANVRAEMNQMKTVAATLTNAKDVAEFQESAKILREIAQQSSEKRPSSITNDADFKGYQEVITALDEADKLAQEGNLDAAKTAAKKLFDIRNVYHKKYK
ncbi:hypothetical protein GEW_04149 [Pasteurella multocida subsp. gallicida str. Anand1_poultry]|nr:hypothetical protein GEW_04149 [Pasteurella multocida subsp. gallicida str. Anand1_poultry]